MIMIVVLQQKPYQSVSERARERTANTKYRQDKRRVAW